MASLELQLLEEAHLLDIGILHKFPRDTRLSATVWAGRIIKDRLMSSTCVFIAMHRTMIKLLCGLRLGQQRLTLCA